MTTEVTNIKDLVIISGMSGAGKTVAVQSFEDMGYFCIDNMPPSLLEKFSELLRQSDKIDKVALVIDIRSREFYDKALSIFADFEDIESMRARVLFLDATDSELVARYKETRRSHPLAMDGRLIDGINHERELLLPIRERAELVIDTTDLSPRQLREKIFKEFEEKDEDVFHIVMMSFGFKYGLPIDADDVMDVRFLPNPYYLPKLRTQSGLQAPVADYVFDKDVTKKFYQQYLDLLKNIIPGYQQEGKTSLTIAIGCTGGQHRSVAIAQRLGNDLRQAGYPVNIVHRDINRYKETVNRS
ncbi:RNase adapter RapZ [Bombilactobacillus bombi]|uniref:RNase adapter RapZ n=1 Tax=Bombilactobacillus bombi TaxID=1303590 RepID=A0A3R6ZVG2_9LACO|nr:RNase adapter RapZ [Bombilactobacillus bombi]RHW47355.1 RNase adapter RapZ [Bombilactobacillus bombi]